MALARAGADTAGALRQRLAAGVRGLFAPGPGAPAFTPAGPGGGLLPDDAVARRIHADVVAMMVGGVAALMLQMLEPRALAGVWDWSDFRRDRLGRLRRTARFIAVTTYGTRADAEASIARVRTIHARVRGRLPDGTPYAADDPELLAHVHVTEVLSFLAAHRRYVRPWMAARDEDRYCAEMALVAGRLGATGLPLTRATAEAWLAAARPRLGADARTHEARRMLTTPERGPLAAMLGHRAAVAAAIDLMPAWARAMHGVPAPPAPARPLLRMSTGGAGALVRWALARPAG